MPAHICDSWETFTKTDYISNLPFRPTCAIMTNLHHNLDSKDKHQVVLSQGSNTQWYTILGPMGNNPRWQIFCNTWASTTSLIDKNSFKISMLHAALDLYTFLDSERERNQILIPKKLHKIHSYFQFKQKNKNKTTPKQKQRMIGWNWWKYKFVHSSCTKCSWYGGLNCKVKAHFWRYTCMLKVTLKLLLGLYVV